MPPRRRPPQQQVKAQIASSNKVLSASLKQLTSNAGRADRVGAIDSSMKIHSDLLKSLVGASKSSLQLYLDLSIPAKLWRLALCQVQLIYSDPALTESVSARALRSCLLHMLAVDLAMPEDLKPAAWAQMLPVAEDGKEGRPCYRNMINTSTYSCFCTHA
jgi:hypothetical protein